MWLVRLHLECKDVKPSYNRCTHWCLVTGPSLRKKKNQFVEDISFAHSLQKLFLLCTTGKLACVRSCVRAACMSACMVNRLLCNSFEILLTETCSASGGVCAWRECREDFCCREMTCSGEDISSVLWRCIIPHTHTERTGGVCVCVCINMCE